MLEGPVRYTVRARSLVDFEPPDEFLNFNRFGYLAFAGIKASAPHETFQLLPGTKYQSPAEPESPTVGESFAFLRD
jgi:hypothetical protein